MSPELGATVWRRVERLLTIRSPSPLTQLRHGPLVLDQSSHFGHRVDRIEILDVTERDFFVQPGSIAWVLP